MRILDFDRPLRYDFREDLNQHVFDNSREAFSPLTWVLWYPLKNQTSGEVYWHGIKKSRG